MDGKKMDRRSWLRAAGIAIGMAAMTGCSATRFGGAGELPDYSNEDFYTDGTFDLEAAKDAYVALMKYHGYPVFEGVREQLWISDYGIGEFANVGLGAVIFFNQEAEHPGDRFMLLDIFLLPNQMLPEHYHLETETARAKMEAWIVRKGTSLIGGEGEPTPDLKEKLPASQHDHVTVWHAVTAGPGDKAELNRATARHWQLAGPQGAIVSEVANFHDNDGVRHTNPNLVFP
ncbi:MAG: hypothetical protein GY711_32285 [bacterium]|nr:hypothetical protein [bacterium]